MNWMNIGHGLPVLDTYVMVCDKLKNIYIAWYGIHKGSLHKQPAFWKNYYYAEFSNGYSAGGSFSTNITHWSPFPDPPEEK